MTPPASAVQRALAINGVVFTGAAALVTFGALALDGLPAGFLPQAAAIAVMVVAVAAAFIPFARPAHRPLAACALVIAACLLLAAPLLVPAPAPATRFVVAVWAAVLLMKVVDLYVGSRRTAPDARTAFAFLFASCLVLRNTPSSQPRRERPLQQVALSAAGTLSIYHAMGYDWTDWPFLLEHSVKILLFAAAAFPACNLLMWAVRRLGGTANDFSAAPAFARTPAEFWRRYNRIVGEFLHYDVGRAVGGVHAPVKAVIAAFAFSAALHEYLLATAAGRAFGFQTAFFALQALAVLATMRLAPRGAAAVAGTILTIAFMLLTSTLFGANIHMAIPIYSNPLPAWLAW
jgi:hypothetical protein